MARSGRPKNFASEDFIEAPKPPFEPKDGERIRKVPQVVTEVLFPCDRNVTEKNAVANSIKSFWSHSSHTELNFRSQLWSQLWSHLWSHCGDTTISGFSMSPVTTLFGRIYKSGRIHFPATFRTGVNNFPATFRHRQNCFPVTFRSHDIRFPVTFRSHQISFPVTFRSHSELFSTHRLVTLAAPCHFSGHTYRFQ